MPRSSSRSATLNIEIDEKFPKRKRRSVLGWWGGWSLPAAAKFMKHQLELQIWRRASRSVEREVLDILEDKNNYSADAASTIWGNGAGAKNSKGVLVLVFRQLTLV
jgi:hypothetical protein